MARTSSARRQVDDPARAALRVSVASVAWTAVAATLAVGLGIASGTGVLVALGAVGVIDGIGSVALVHHFRHVVHHDSWSDELERRAHLIVLAGLLTVGTAAVVTGVAGLATGHEADATVAGSVVAAASMVVSGALARRKQVVAGPVVSAALRSDGHVSAIGACEAAIALVGTGLTGWLGWSAADPVATAAVGCGAVALSVTTYRSEHRHR